MKIAHANDIFPNRGFITMQDIFSNKRIDESLMRKAIEEQTSLQCALIEEYIYRVIMVVENPSLNFDFCGLNYEFFCNQKDIDIFKKNLQTVYGTIKAITNKNGDTMGFHVYDTFTLALDIIKEKYEQGSLPEYIYHFLTLDQQFWDFSAGELSIMLERNFDKCNMPLDFQESPFYKEVERNLNAAGFYCFFTNKLTIHELETDDYLQAMIDLGHKVYVHRSATEPVMKRIIIISNSK